MVREDSPDRPEDDVPEAESDSAEEESDGDSDEADAEDSDGAARDAADDDSDGEEPADAADESVYGAYAGEGTAAPAAAPLMATPAPNRSPWSRAGRGGKAWILLGMLVCLAAIGFASVLIYIAVEDEDEDGDRDGSAEVRHGDDRDKDGREYDDRDDDRDDDRRDDRFTADGRDDDYAWAKEDGGEKDWAKGAAGKSAAGRPDGDSPVGRLAGCRAAMRTERLTVLLCPRGGTGGDDFAWEGPGPPMFGFDGPGGTFGGPDRFGGGMFGFDGQGGFWMFDGPGLFGREAVPGVPLPEGIPRYAPFTGRGPGVWEPQPEGWEFFAQPGDESRFGPQACTNGWNSYDCATTYGDWFEFPDGLPFGGWYGYADRTPWGDRPGEGGPRFAVPSPAPEPWEFPDDQSLFPPDGPMIPPEFLEGLGDLALGIPFLDLEDFPGGLGGLIDMIMGFLGGAGGLPEELGDLGDLLSESGLGVLDMEFIAELLEMFLGGLDPGDFFDEVAPEELIPNDTPAPAPTANTPAV